MRNSWRQIVGTCGGVHFTDRFVNDCVVSERSTRNQRGRGRGRIATTRCKGGGKSA